MKPEHVIEYADSLVALSTKEIAELEESAKDAFEQYIKLPFLRRLGLRTALNKAVKGTLVIAEGRMQVIRDAELVVTKAHYCLEQGLMLYEFPKNLQMTDWERQFLRWCKGKGYCGEVIQHKVEGG